MLPTLPYFYLYLRGWVTNNLKLQEQLNLDGVLAKQPEQAKVLGLVWNTISDTVTFKLSDSNDPEITKRSCLSLMSQLFDPLGLLTPVTIKSRIFLQGLWVLKTDWDQPLEGELIHQWHSLREDLYRVSKLEIPRAVTRQNTAELHIFSDASNKAYGACAFICHNGETSLIMGKAKVAPLKPLTIPKLELTALLLAARLAKFIHAAYENTLHLNSTNLWCDSQIALCWVTTNKPLPTYVANRVKEIKDLSSNIEINYIATKDNPADLLTRGLSSHELAASTLWWEGPPWLPHREQWPVNELKPPTEINILNLQTPLINIINWERFSSYNKCLRAIAWIYRYKNNLKRKVEGLAINTDPNLNVSTIRTAEEIIIRLVQREGFTKECDLLEQGADRSYYTDIMLQLGLCLKDNIIVCSGRIQTAALPEAARHPILLPRHHPLTRLLILHCHEINHHYGTNSTVAYMREKWWIPKMRQAVKGILRDCRICKRHQGKSYSQSDAPPLPSFRTNIQEPFSFTGVDYTGALKSKGRRLPKSQDLHNNIHLRHH